jgi:hypothetical protein
VEEAIKVAEDRDTTPNVQIKVDTPSSAKEVQVSIPVAAINTVAESAAENLVIESNVGSVTLPSEVLASIAEQAGSGNVSVSVGEVDKETALTPGMQRAVGDNPVYDISILSRGENISEFGGGRISITLPYPLPAGRVPRGVIVYYLRDAGTLVGRPTIYDAATGTVTFTTDHLSKYVIGYDEAAAVEQSFTDVLTTDWFYGDVEFVTTHQPVLFNGTSSTTFSPYAPTTRGMLWAVLARLEGENISGADWLINAQTWAQTNGVSDGTMPNQPLTRNMIVTMLYRYAGIGKDGFSGEALAWAEELGIMTGGRPDDAATRAEVAAMLHRFVEKVQ